MKRCHSQTLCQLFANSLPTFHCEILRDSTNSTSTNSTKSIVLL